MIEISPTPSTLPTNYLPGERSDADELDGMVGRLCAADTLRDLLEVLPGPVAVLNEFRQIVAANGRLLSTLGLEDRSELFGRRPGEALNCVAVPESPSGCGTSEKCVYCGLVNTVVESLRTGSAASGECRIRSRDGDAMEWEVTATPTVVGADHLVYVGLRDIAGQKRRELLERTFFHDVLNTAGGIRGLLSVVDEQADDGEWTEMRGSLVTLADDLIEEILGHRELSTAEAGNLEVRVSRFDLAGLLHRLRSLYGGHQVARGRQIVMDPPASRTIQTDVTLLRRVLGNMLKNALEATPVGESVHVDAAIGGEDLTVEVRNPGVMSAEVREQVFQRSFSTKGPGRGIGTYSIKLLGERYLGGTVSFSSDEGSGTRFRIRLPGVVTAVAETSNEQESAPDLAGRRVLIADDSPVNRLIVRRRLETWGCDVTETVDGGEALAKFQQSPFDVVILDLEMPVLGGLEAARRIREGEVGTYRRATIIALTGSSGPEERARCLAAGMDEVLGKPVAAENLRMAVGR